MRWLLLQQDEPNTNPYHQRVLDAANDEVIFPGAIYDMETVQSLRFFAHLYIHGHTGGRQSVVDRGAWRRKSSACTR